MFQSSTRPSIKLVLAANLLTALLVTFGNQVACSPDVHPVDNLMQVCDHPANGYLDRSVISENYLHLIDLFKKNDEIREVLEQRLESFMEASKVTEFQFRNSNRRSSRHTQSLWGPNKVLEEQTNVLCAMVEYMDDYVQDKLYGSR